MLITTIKSAFWLCVFAFAINAAHHSLLRFYILLKKNKKFFYLQMII
ncbi:MAG: hypothetical protein SO045_05700 [Campylobacter sp.]|nr:hypothetical protein [Campylobacter sp.]